MTDERVLTLWVIYESPSDYPGKVVVRRQHSRRRAVDIDLEAWVFDSITDRRARRSQRGCTTLAATTWTIRR